MASKTAAELRGWVCGPMVAVVRSKAAGALCGAAALGESLGRSLVTRERVLVREAKVLRQPLVNRLVHWSVALSIVALFLSGFGQMPLYKRYMVADLPGLGWTADYGATLLIHYLAAMVLMLAVAFHLGYHGIRRELGCLPRRGDVRQSILILRAMILRGKEPPSEKYLAEQRLAYAAIGGSVLVLILSGLVKVAKNLPGVSLDATVVAASTHLHNLAMALLLLTVLGHLLAFVIPANRKLIPGMLHGKVDLDYAEHRHPLWCRRLASGGRSMDQPQPMPEARSQGPETPPIGARGDRPGAEPH